MDIRYRLIVVLLAIHFLAEYWLPPARLKRYANGWNNLCMHIILHSLCMLTMCCLFFTWIEVLAKTWLIWLVLCLGHGLLDAAHVYLNKNKEDTHSGYWLFLIHQALMTAWLWIIVWYGIGRSPDISRFYQGQYATFINHICLYLLMFILIWDFASDWVKKLFCFVPAILHTEGHDQYALKTSANSGELIGKLERLIIALFVLYGHYAGVGFVLTAKSLARFKMLEDHDFAERYLIGTLSSTIIAIIVGYAGSCLLALP